jgi:ATP-dependent DNA helicase RecG
VPIYPLVQGISQRGFRSIIKYALNEYLAATKDFLPYDIRARHNFLNLAKSLLQIHFPDDIDLQKEAYRRLSFEEFFLFQVPLALRKSKNKEKKGIAHCVEGKIAADFIASLPFKLTEAQVRVLGEIKSDMARPEAMQRLLQGDVGSGKTVVAVITALTAVQGGYQATLMAPTEILAKQHYENICCQLSVLSCQNEGIKTGLLLGSLNKKEKAALYQKVEKGEIDLIIGTHALLEETVKFKNLGLVVIDEQHKFGVGQRALLPKKGPNPDVLIMTATPIPRTLAITLYGDLDISVIDELPRGRGSIKTMLFKQSEKPRVYELAKEQVRKGNQVYIIYPVIEESYALDIAGAENMYEEFRQGVFRDLRLGLIHGRMPRKEQDLIMQKFKAKELDILVSTSILEVGIDIPNATCMIVQYAERFGLSQLHQLRGRIGRGAQDSLCLLISDAVTIDAKARLEALVKYINGFYIAEEDLKIRGPGEFFGQRQHGLTELRIGDPLKQMQLLKLAREEAIKLIRLDPNLELKQNAELKKKLLERFPEYDKLLMVA